MNGQRLFMVIIELVYVAMDKAIVLKTLELKQGSTVHDGLIESEIYITHPETRDMLVGIFAKQVGLEQVLKDGDRIEIYRPLVLDPKEKRRQKANVIRKKSNANIRVSISLDRA